MEIYTDPFLADRVGPTLLVCSVDIHKDRRRRVIGHQLEERTLVPNEYRGLGGPFTHSRRTNPLYGHRQPL